MIEKWVDIEGYEKEYQISNYGRLKSLKNNLIMKPMIATNGYLIACLWKNGKQKKYVIHRLVAKAFLDNPNNYKEVNHIDEDKNNNNVNNLEWCSHKYNMNYGKVRENLGGELPIDFLVYVQVFLGLQNEQSKLLICDPDSDYSFSVGFENAMKKLGFSEREINTIKISILLKSIHGFTEFL